MRLTWRRRRSEEGAVAILVAVALTALLVAVAMVLDFGVVRTDRQMNKSSADAASMAGLKGFDRGDGRIHSYAGICQALEYLRLSQPDLANLPAASSAPGNVTCPATSAQTDLVCEPGVTDLSYTATVGSVDVQIHSPYLVSEGGFAEETSNSLLNDDGDVDEGGCDQIAVIITETKSPGLGSLATSADLVSRIRSVGRVTIGNEGDVAVALLLLDRTECEVLAARSTGTRIVVQGFGETPGTIHSDSIATASCNGSAKLFYGNDDYSIVAEQSVTPPQSPGIITARALSGAAGADAAKAQGLFPKVVAKPDPGGVTPGDLVSRSVVDSRYLAGVRAARDQANSLFNASAAPAGWTSHTDCSDGSTAAGKIWVDCTNFSPASASFPNATELLFRGRVSGSVNMPIATRVYIQGNASPYGLNAGSFRMHHFGSATCPSTNVASRAQLVIRRGQFTTANNSSQVQLCNTAVVMLGNDSDACLPTTSAQAYTTNTCDGLLKVTTGTIRWTAPDAVGPSDRTAADFAALEDLALWTEMSGSGHALSGNLYLAGVFMLPNAKPFNITGGGVMQVENSQYIVDKLDVTGSGTLTMRPDPADSVTIPRFGGFQLVR